MKVALGRLHLDDYRTIAAFLNHLEQIFARIPVNEPMTIGGGAVIQKHYSQTATLNFGAPGGVPGSVDLTITVTGAALGDTVTVGAPVTVGANYVLTAFVSAANTVTVRWTQIAGGAADPDGAGGTYRVDVWKH